MLLKFQSLNVSSRNLYSLQKKSRDIYSLDAADGFDGNISALRGCFLNLTDAISLFILCNFLLVPSLKKEHQD